MMVDEAVEKAQLVCREFLAAPLPNSSEGQLGALKPVFEAVQRVLAASMLATGKASAYRGLALELFRAHRNTGDVHQWVKINLMSDGMVVKEDSITCPTEEHVFHSSAYPVELLDVLKSGIPAKDMVGNIVRFLANPIIIGVGSQFQN